MKTVYIIPGLSENTSQKAYQQIIKQFKSNKFKVIPINISWNYKTMTNYIDQFLNKYKPNKKDKVYLFGFSFGAMISLIVATKIKLKTVVLCSLSPWFKEDHKHNRKSWLKLMGKRQLKDLKNYSFNELVKKIKCKTILVAGDKEGRELERRVNETHAKLKNSELIIIPKAKHNISQKEYQEALINIIKTLK